MSPSKRKRAEALFDDSENLPVIFKRSSIGVVKNPHSMPQHHGRSHSNALRDGTAHNEHHCDEAVTRRKNDEMAILGVHLNEAVSHVLDPGLLGGTLRKPVPIQEEEQFCLPSSGQMGWHSHTCKYSIMVIDSCP